MLKENKLTALALVVMIVIAIFRPININVQVPTDSPLLGQSGSRFPSGVSADTTSPATGEVRGTTLTITATTTADNNLDGGFAEDFITLSATGTAKMVYTNGGGPKWCDGSSGGIYANEVTTTASPLAPSLVFVMGTTTSATGYSANLMASTTVASTTDKLLVALSSRFILDSTDSITVSIADGTTGIASSTYFSNWKLNFKISCSLLEA